MLSQPVLSTTRLRLRPFELSDAPEVQRLAGEREIADTTGNIPHPYKDGVAEAWIESLTPGLEQETMINYAITLLENGQLIGSIGLTGISKAHNHAELGYWIGKPWWGGGYCTEAAKALLAHGFEALSLNRIHAHYMARNPASGRVMEKLGMSREGCLRQHVRKNGVYEDAVFYGILRSEWQNSTA